jgi:hypothetical protein
MIKIISGGQQALTVLGWMSRFNGCFFFGDATFFL